MKNEFQHDNLQPNDVVDNPQINGSGENNNQEEEQTLSFARIGFKIPRPTNEYWSINDVKNLITTKDDDGVVLLNKEPDYQRKPVWIKSFMIEFIKTVLLKGELESLKVSHYKTDNLNPDIKYMNLCDGLQRVTTIEEFTLDNLKSSYKVLDTSNKDFFSVLEKVFTSYEDINKHYKAKSILDEKIIPVRVYNTQYLTKSERDEWERVFFNKSLNNAVNLVNSERRNSITGIYQNQLKEVVEKFDSPTSRIYARTKKAPDRDRFALQEQIEKFIYRDVENKYFEPSITPKKLSLFKEDKRNSDFSLNISNFLFCHNIVVNNNNLKSHYWNHLGKRTKDQVGSPLINKDLVNYGMMLLRKYDKTEVKDILNMMTGLTYFYEKQYKDNPDTMDQTYKKKINEFQSLCAASTSTTDPKRKEFWDYICEDAMTRVKSKIELETV